MLLCIITKRKYSFFPITWSDLPSPICILGKYSHLSTKKECTTRDIRAYTSTQSHPHQLQSHFDRQDSVILMFSSYDDSASRFLIYSILWKPYQFDRQVQGVAELISIILHRSSDLDLVPHWS